MEHERPIFEGEEYFAIPGRFTPKAIVWNMVQSNQLPAIDIIKTQMSMNELVTLIDDLEVEKDTKCSDGDVIFLRDVKLLILSPSVWRGYNDLKDGLIANMFLNNIRVTKII